jgi:hypothetical protein
MLALAVIIPPELTSAALTALGLVGTWFAVGLARKGKREDIRIADANQTFTQLNELSNQRLAEITRLAAALSAATLENERLRTAWESRWDRQMKRCRQVTDSLVQALNALRKLAGPNAKEDADEVLRVISAHNQDDHDEIT